MATLGMHRDFLMEFAGLEKSVQKRVFEVFEKFTAATHTGLHLEKLTNQRDPRLRTIRINDFWRGVVLKAETGDSYLLLKVLPHNKANDWAAKHRASVNEATQGIEIRNDIALERATAGLRARAAEEPARLFPVSEYPDKVLRALGVDEEILPIIRLVPDETHLEALHKVLPEQQYDVLLGLATGMSPEEIDRELVQAYARTAPPVTGADTGATEGDELGSAMARARGRVALVSGTDELQDILQRPFDAWRIFLHPSQYRVAYQDGYAGPARVTGGPGTGKTVVALHRAYHLARELPAGSPDGCVLLTTYTKDLAAELERCLALLVTDPAVRAKVRVVNVDALANEIVRADRGGAPLKLVFDQREILGRWARIARQVGAGFPDVFLDQEWRQVVLAQALTSPEEYLKASRAGRGTALSPLRRLQVWRAVSTFEEQLRRSGEWTFLQVCAEAARILDGGRQRRPFRHVVVDEAQDLHPAQWRFLRALAAPGRDDLFLAGDTFQRIYGNRVSLRSLGIRVTGRSHRLRINYRTTQEILSWSAALLTGEGAEDMDGGAETLTGYRSSLYGERPEASGYATRAAEIEALVHRVREWITSGVEAEDIGVAVRFLQLGRDIAGALQRAGVPVCVLGSGRTEPGVRIATMHRMKGLEFRCVAVAGVNDGTVPMTAALTPAEVDPRQHQEDLHTELSLLFVACTRAREALRVSWHGAPSPFLASVTDRPAPRH
ncbi:UvrD-helicase domain-containing protein [Streptomyces aidingensis]|uniref:DNA 3'-5' helicase n=1 Tax=Streptomyces aidingensis TaxID=910347 RepID=A0A1I1UR75_9ACTN|nr:UvrD-helicase domain-containing protein [Streptomyces aidingensis]SFD73287.1 UvrD/REP helicase N-terminal domain-containing protein [Streptomyces aidingensis]